jgi:hypothetical protein
MPFKSEKQRRYLWANEPEIARDWTNTYGHRTQGQDGGVMRVPFAEAGSTNWDPNLLDLNTTGIKGQEIMDRWKRDIKKLRDTIERPDLYGLDEESIEFNKSQLENLENKFKGKMFDKNPKSSLPKERGWFKELLGIGEAEGSIPTEKERIALMNSVQGNDIGNAWEFDPNHVREAIARYKMQKMMNEPQGIQTLDRSEFIDDANYIPKWNEYTDDPEYDEEEGEDQPKKRFSEYEFFDEYLRDNPQLYQGIAQNLGRGIGKTRDALGNIYQGGKRRGMQGLDLLGTGYQLAKRSFPISLLFGGLKSAFSPPYKAAAFPAGGYSVAQQNQMNAAGGYYSEPAREGRRTLSRIEDMKARRARGDPYSKTNLANLLQQTGQQDDWTPPAPKVPVTPRHSPHQHHHGGGGQGSGGGGGIPDVARDLGMKGSYDQGHT